MKLTRLAGWANGRKSLLVSAGAVVALGGGTAGQAFVRNIPIFATTTTTATRTTEPPPPADPWNRPDFIRYSCSDSFYLDGALATGSNNGKSWTNAWRSVGAVDWKSIGSDDCLLISGGSTSTTYSSALKVGTDGTNGHPVKILSGQDAGHNGVVIFNGVGIDAGGADYVTIDGEGADAASQHIRIANSGGGSVSQAVNPTWRYIELDGGSLSGTYGSGGLFDHLYLHNISDDAAITFAARNCLAGPTCNDPSITGYDKTILENSHVMVNNSPSNSGAGSDGVQGCPGCTYHANLFEGCPGCGPVNGRQHQDLIQSQAFWTKVYDNVFKDGADSSFDFDCGNNNVHPSHFLIYDNVFIKARGGSSIRFYNSCQSFDNIHIDSNTFIDHTASVSGYGNVNLNGFNAANPTVSNSEIQHNVFYNDDVSAAILIDPSSGFTAADWHVDYNNRSGGSGAFRIDGARYAQAHPLACTPSFVRYVEDTTPYSGTYATLTSGGYDLALAGRLHYSPKAPSGSASIGKALHCSRG